MKIETKNNDSIIRELYALGALDWLSQGGNSSWLRVPGGWVYTNRQGAVFIPFDNEFQGKKEEPTEEMENWCICKKFNHYPGVFHMISGLPICKTCGRPRKGVLKKDLKNWHVTGVFGMKQNEK